MKRNNYFNVLFATTCFVFIATSCSTSSQKTAKNNTEVMAVSPEDIVKRGEYLVTIIGCNDGHSLKKIGPKVTEIITELLFSCYPSDRPIVKFYNPMIKEGFGMFYPDLTAGASPRGFSSAANLTSGHKGIGTWAKEQFKKALMEGKFRGIDVGHILLTTMPWFNFTQLKDEDVSAIFACQKSLKPVINAVPQPITPDKM